MVDLKRVLALPPIPPPAVALENGEGDGAALAGGPKGSGAGALLSEVPKGEGDGALVAVNGDGGGALDGIEERDGLAVAVLALPPNREPPLNPKGSLG